MMHAALGLPLEKARKLVEEAGKECVLMWTLPPRRPDKTGSARVVRAKEEAGTVFLTVSFFEDALEEET